MKDCPDCYLHSVGPFDHSGNGKCGRCYGTGYSNTPYAKDLGDKCLDCRGSGICQTCNGSGKCDGEEEDNTSSYCEKSEPPSRTEPSGFGESSPTTNSGGSDGCFSLLLLPLGIAMILFSRSYASSYLAGHKADSAFVCAMAIWCIFWLGVSAPGVIWIIKKIRGRS